MCVVIFSYFYYLFSKFVTRQYTALKHSKIVNLLESGAIVGLGYLH